jgi:hypothetical protein
MSPDMSLDEARDWLRQRVEKGDRCPCCSQFAKVYKKAITATSARVLILLWKTSGRDYGYIPAILTTGPTMMVRASGGDYAKLAYWGLIEPLPEKRPDGGKAGWWRVTELGERWIYRTVTVPEYARIYAGRCLNLTGKEVSIVDALGTRFNLAELMAR